MTDGIVNLKGKRYYTVARRVHDFRAACSIADGWGLVSSMVSIDAETIIMRGAVIDPQGREVAVGYAEEKRSSRGVNSTSALENAETSALGRALAAAGFGGDGAYASADELTNALRQQRQTWTGSERAAFMARLSALEVSPSAVARYAEERGWGSPAGWTPEARGAFVADLATGKIPALYNSDGEK